MVDDQKLREPDPVDWDSYEDGGKKFVPLAPEGIYTVAESGPPTLEITDDGYLTYVLSPLKIVDEGPGKGQEIRYTRISTKQWPGRNASSMGDYLRAKGIKLQGKPTNEMYQQAVMAATNLPFQINASWKGRCPACKNYFKRAEVYPTREDGTKQSYMDCPNGCKDPEGVVNEETGEVRPARVFANLTVGWFVRKG